MLPEQGAGYWDGTDGLVAALLPYQPREDMDFTGTTIPASQPRQPGGPADSSSCGPLKSRATRGHILPGAPICRTALVSQRASLLGPGWQLLEKHVFHIKISLEEQWFKPSIKKKKKESKKKKEDFWWSPKTAPWDHELLLCPGCSQGKVGHWDSTVGPGKDHQDTTSPSDPGIRAM